jgi:hypothetical protein
MKYYKIIDPAGHNGLIYHEGLNEDPLPFNPSGECDPGGIYFAREDILAFLDYGTDLYEVEPVGPVYENPGWPKKYKSHAVNLKYIGKVRDNIEFLIKQGADIHGGKDLVLVFAVKQNNLKLVKWLLKRDVDVDCWQGLPLCISIEQNNLKLVKLLIKQGANVNVMRGLPLRIAIFKNNVAIVKVLLKAGADIDCGDNSTPLDLAFTCDNKKIIKLLLKAATTKVSMHG